MNLRDRVKKRAKDKGIPVWKVAAEYGLSDSNFSRMLRYDEKVSKETEDKIYSIIDDLAGQG